jgi:hypothetical protein
MAPPGSSLFAGWTPHFRPARTHQGVPGPSFSQEPCRTLALCKNHPANGGTAMKNAVKTLEESANLSGGPDGR